MSLITQCPACGTSFKVVRDQLKISEGWVRCGQCAEVFDTAPNLRELDLSSVEAGNAGGSSFAQCAPADPLGMAPFTGYAPQQHLEPAWLPEAAEFTSVSNFAPVPPVDDGHPEVSDPFARDALSGVDARPLAAPAWIEPSPIDAAPVSGAGDREASPSAQSRPEAVTDLANHSDFPFIAAARRTSRWHAPVVRAGLTFSVLLLLLGLAGQWLFHERDHVAALEPRLRSVLQNLCDAMQSLRPCQIRPWRQLDALAVESSSFNKLRGNTYRLNFVVVNIATMTVARPAIELTLTDSQDAPLLRRVLLPEVLSPAADVLAAGREWEGSYVVTVGIDADTLSKNVAGYRLLAFYP